MTETTHQSAMQTAGPSTGDLVGALLSGKAATLAAMLQAQCRLADAAAGAIVRLRPTPAPSEDPGQPPEESSVVDVLAAVPPPPAGAAIPVWLARGAEVAPEASATGRTALIELPADGAVSGYLVVIPLRSDRERGEPFRGAGIFLFRTGDAGELGERRKRLELAMALFGLHEAHIALSDRAARLARMSAAMHVLAAVGEATRLRAAAMALVNEIATRFHGDRVSLGLVRGDAVRLEAMSHTEKIVRKMQVVQDLEAAMEECIDQDEEILWPPPAGAMTICHEASELARRHGGARVITVPMKRGADVVGAVTVERPADAPMEPDELEALRLTIEMCAPRTVDLRDRDLWIGGKAARATRRAAAWAVGPRHTGAKVLAVALLAFLAFAFLAHGTDTVDGAFVLSPPERRVAAAPFDGYIRDVLVEPGDDVVAGVTVLAELETAELRLARSAAAAERAVRLQEADAARTAGRIAEALIAEAGAEEIAARIDLLDHHLARARIVAPIDGVVIAAELEDAPGAPVRRGQVIAEVADVSALDADLLVPEDRIADVEPGQQGALAAASYPDRRIGFTVASIAPVAEVVGGRNVFRVRATLDDRPVWMRPGMEGTAKIRVGRARYASLWTRELVDWLRMRLWI